MAPESIAPFADLPAALLEEVLAQSTVAGESLLESLSSLKDDRKQYRDALIEKRLIQRESDLGRAVAPTTCGTDGSYAIERLLSSDLAAAAAVAVEGLTPPSEKRHWSQPHHITFVVPEPHHPNTATILRSVMLGRELTLASDAPHDLVMIDATLTLPIIYLNQALNSAPSATMLSCAKEFLHHCVDYLRYYEEVLISARSDKNYIGLPKYSTRREVGIQAEWPAHQDDRGFLTLLLEGGELTKPLVLQEPDQEWHLNIGRLPEKTKKSAKEIAGRIVDGLNNVHVFYYKPHDWLPALRIEVARNIANNRHRLATVVQGLKEQCAVPSILEPYPLYLADRTVKALARAMPSFRQVASQRIAENYKGNIDEVFFAMHGYRSESGGRNHG